ncbi:MAG: hypothetical protein ABUL50_05895, partial [Rhizobacter sp.]
MSTRAARVVAAGVAGAITLLFALLAAGVWWGVGSERGSAWLLSLIPGVQVDAPRGRLLGDFEARQIRLQLPGSADRAVLDDVKWRGLTVARADAPLWLRIGIDTLDIARVDVAIAPTASSKPPTPPTDLRLPIELEVRAVHVGALHATPLGAEPIRDLRAHLHLGANTGSEHRVDLLALAWDRLQASGTARIAGSAPMQL